jgi:hypothetical protein
VETAYFQQTQQSTGQIPVPSYNCIGEITISEDEFVASDILIPPMTVTRTVISENPDETAEDLPSSEAAPMLDVPNTEEPPPVQKFNLEDPFFRGRLRKETREFAEATGSGQPAKSFSQASAKVVEDVVGELPTTTSAIPVVASFVQVAPSSVPHPSSTRRAIIMGNRRKECVPREKGPLKRFAETRDYSLCPPSKRAAPSGENYMLLFPYS